MSIDQWLLLASKIRELTSTFFQIGLLGFGGGYAFLPMIHNEMTTRGFLTSLEFGNLVAVAEMTPGPIAINTATLVGSRVAGLLGSFAATLGVILPSTIIILLAAPSLIRHKDHPILKGLFSGLRPVVTALILTAAVFLLQTNFDPLFDWSQLLSSKEFWLTLGVALPTGALLLWTKTHPIILIVGAALIGLGIGLL